ncbi:AraC family transcriptional regulator [Nocardia puris]|nr:AraC family transcriptional regulator [Nocardia puris]
MDVLDSMLHETRARHASIRLSRMDPPWHIRFLDRSPLTVLAMVGGDGWLLRDDRDPVPLTAGSIAIVRGPEPYAVADAPGTPPRVLVESADFCTDDLGRDISESRFLGPHTWGDHAAAPAALVTGLYPIRSEVSDWLLDALPPVLIVPPDQLESPLMDLVTAEIAADRPGQQVILDRAMDLLLVCTLRAWFDRADSTAPGWYRALGDPVAGPALRLIHDDPAHPWTVAALAAAVGVSRAAFARRFGELVGEPPVSYLTSWRIALAADRLRHTDDTLATIARRVGYSDGYALSVAFTRVKGVRPGEFRG